MRQTRVSSNFTNLHADLVLLATHEQRLAWARTAILPPETGMEKTRLSILDLEMSRGGGARRSHGSTRRGS